MTRQWPLLASDSHRFYDWMSIGVLNTWSVCFVSLVYRWPTMIAISAHVTDSPDRSHHMWSLVHRWPDAEGIVTDSTDRHISITSYNINKYSLHYWSIRRGLLFVENTNFWYFVKLKRELLSNEYQILRFVTDFQLVNNV
jgi:hypothetical protein